MGVLGAEPLSGILEKGGVIGEGNNQRSFKVKHLYPKKFLSLEATLAVRLEASPAIPPLIYSSSISDSGRPIINKISEIG